MPSIIVPLGTGVESPPKIGTPIIKPTSGGRLSYSQNVDFSNDEYGEGFALPGPSLTNVGNNSELTGVPFVSALYAVSGVGFLWFAEGLLGAANKLRKVENLVSGGTVQIDTDNLTVTDGGHANVLLTDLLIRNVSGTYTAFLIGRDDTDGWYKTFLASAGGAASIGTTQTLTTFNTGREPKAVLGPDNVVYVGHGYHLDSVDTSGTYDSDSFVLPMGNGVTALARWQNFMAIGYNDDFPHNFATRLNAGRSGIMLWDYDPGNSFFERDVPCPSRYISAIVADPDGSTLVFGGVDEGRTTVYQFDGYGLDPLTSYVGDMPRSRHSVSFDGQGRLLWQTADGQLMRYDKRRDRLSHLGSIATGSSAGGLLARAIGGTSSNTHFLAASGSGSTYTMKRVTFGSFVGDGAGSDGVTTPLVISGLKFLPPRSTITAITLHLGKSLETGEKVTLRAYKNGSLTGTDVFDMAYSADGAISSKRKSIPITNVNNFAIGVAWKQADGLTTSPPVAYAEVEWSDNI